MKGNHLVSFVLVFLLFASFLLPTKATLADEENDYFVTCEYLGGKYICVKNNPITIIEGTTPGLTNLFLSSDLSNPLPIPGFPAPTAAGYDLANHSVSSGFGANGRRSSIINIVMKSGNIGSIKGGGGGGTNGDLYIRVEGGTLKYGINTRTYWPATSDAFNGSMTIDITGGSMPSVSCGGNAFFSSNTLHVQANKGDCKIRISGGEIAQDVSVDNVDPQYIGSIDISGGIIGGRVNIGTDSRELYTVLHTEFPSRVTVSGGTLKSGVYNHNASVTYDSDLIITGGSINGTIEQSPTNGSVPVYRTLLTLPGIRQETPLKNGFRLNGVTAQFGNKDLLTTATGELVFYLPEGSSYASYQGMHYRADVRQSIDPNNVFLAVYAPVTIIPSTGDATPLVVYMMLLTLSCVLFCITAVFRKRNSSV